MVSYLSFLLLLTSSNGEFRCLNEETTITYSNAETIEVTLPTVRLIQGYYGSQYAMQYVAYVYLREKLGLNVSFYPGSDPNSLGDLIATELSATYPHFYFQWLAQDRYDLLFEMWGQVEAVADAIHFYTNGTVLEGGLSGVYAEIGWFTPSYLFQTNPEMIVPDNMVHDESIRTAFKNAYIYNASRDYVNYSLVLNNSVQHGYDQPTYSGNPILFTSSPYYASTEHHKNLAENLFNDTWDVVPLGNEGLLSEFVKDLYSKRLPFVAGIYDPHIDFATVINETTGEKMSFETILLPRNPSNSAEDECFTDGMCQFPRGGLTKIGNPKLRDTFPELLNFLSLFKMSTNDVNFILGAHRLASADQAALNLTDHELWELAACQWLNISQTTTDRWHIDIKRYLCEDGSVSMFECIEYQNSSLSSLQVTIFGLSGVIALVLVVWMIYKIIGWCKNLQRNFGGGAASDLENRERRRLIISILTDCTSLAIGFFDFGTDSGALVSILTVGGYSDLFVTMYFVMTVLAAFASTAHILVTVKNIINDIGQIKSGTLQQIENELEDIVPTDSDSAANNDDDERKGRGSLVKKTNREIKKLKFKTQLLSKTIKQQTTTIFVAFIEDVPFYILNMIALWTSSTINKLLLMSLSINAVSIGFKLCVTREFFANLIQKAEIKESINNLTEMMSKQQKQFVLTMTQTADKKHAFTFRANCIKRVLQRNEDVGKVKVNASETVIKFMELLTRDILNECNDIIVTKNENGNNAKKKQSVITVDTLHEAISSDERLSFINQFISTLDQKIANNPITNKEENTNNEQEKRKRKRSEISDDNEDDVDSNLDLNEFALNKPKRKRKKKHKQKKDVKKHSLAKETSDNTFCFDNVFGSMT